VTSLAAAGQSPYSPVVTVSGTGRIVFIAGTLARDIGGNRMGKGDMRAQMEQTGPLWAVRGFIGAVRISNDCSL
jgi:enamine deaminase RidA (YjgF/YER057c/UK114 family)